MSADEPAACSAVQLPFADDAFDASWSMSTLMHLPDDGPPRPLLRQRSDEDLQSLLAQVGDVTAFETWHWFDDRGHYQWARVRVRDDE